MGVGLLLDDGTSSLDGWAAIDDDHWAVVAGCVRWPLTGARSDGELLTSSAMTPALTSSLSEAAMVILDSSSSSFTAAGDCPALAMVGKTRQVQKQPRLQQRQGDDGSDTFASRVASELVKNLGGQGTATQKRAHALLGLQDQ